MEPGFEPKLQPQSLEILSVCSETGSSGAQSEQKPNLDGQLCSVFLLSMGMEESSFLQVCIHMCVTQ